MNSDLTSNRVLRNRGITGCRTPGAIVNYILSNKKNLLEVNRAVDYLQTVFVDSFREDVYYRLRRERLPEEVLSRFVIF